MAVAIIWLANIYMAGAMIHTGEIHVDLDVCLTNTFMAGQNVLATHVQ